jgi:hypothetical protein
VCGEEKESRGGNVEDTLNFREIFGRRFNLRSNALHLAKKFNKHFRDDAQN